MIKKEIWKFIKDFPDYEVSNTEQVRSWKGGCLLAEACYILKPIIEHKGYYRVHLHHNLKSASRSIHRLVLEAFIGECPKGYQANHKDGIKIHNDVENLEWVTPQQNMQHAIETGLKPMLLGEKSSNVVLKDREVWLIKRLLWFEILGTVISKMFKVDPVTISNINTERTWSHIIFVPTEKDRKYYKENMT